MRKFLIVGLMAAAAVPVIAQTAPVAPMPPMPPMAAMADKVMTRADVQTKVQAHFTRLDANRDGFVTTAEIDAGRKAHKGGGQGHGGDRMTMDHDGAMAGPASAFDRLDANRDGMISRDEFTKGHAKRMAMKGDGADHHPGMMKMHGRGMDGMMGGMMFKMADANKDGRVSLQEATAKALQHFDQADANRDGRITPEERRVMHQRMMQEHGRKAS